MSREIKFRVWQKSTKSMIYEHEFIKITGREVLKLDPQIEKNRWFVVEDEFVFMQFTGLTDKLGKDIYKGDILAMWGEEPGGGFDQEVICEYGSFGYKTEGVFHPFASHWAVSKPQINDAVIIGNIYENPTP